MASDDVQIIKPSTRLRDKVGAGGNAQFNAKAIERTEKAVAAKGKDYTAKVRKDVEDLRQMVRTAAEGGDATAEQMKKIAMVAREIKGQAATFNFPLLTKFGDGLFNFTDNMTELTPKRVAVIEAHVDAMAVVLAQNMHGDGGAIGNKLVRGLDLAIEKFKQG
ncbi:MAG: hypothetical protein AAF213_00895 [Pseudomonadota bacterium]